MPVSCSAETQGMTDKYIATWLRQQKRDGVVLATKVAGYGNKYLRKNGEETRITVEQVEESVNNSLQRLGTDYIDLLQVFLRTRVFSCCQDLIFRLDGLSACKWMVARCMVVCLELLLAQSLQFWDAA